MILNRQHRKANLVKAMLTAARHRAKKKGVPFSITEDDVHVPELCPVFGWKMEVNEGRDHRDRKNSPSLDRIIPELGYVPGNVVVVSNLANAIKNIGTPEQIRAVADFYAEG